MLAVVRPVISYGCVVRWLSLHKISQRKILDMVKRNAAFSITAVRKSCPKATLIYLFLLATLDLYVKQCAAHSPLRLRESGCCAR